jgi:hypothetical protein
MKLSIQQEQLIIMLPETEYGRALNAWLDDEIERIAAKLDLSGKICDDPLIEDFRTQMGISIGLKRVKKKPQELRETRKGALK